MDTARVLTTQNVAINYDIASVGERVLARLLDLVLFAAYLLLVFWLTGIVISNMDFESIEKYTVLIYVLVTLPVLTYTAWCESIFNGRSFGKLVLGLKVVKTDGTPAGIGDFAFRWVMRLVEGEYGIFSCLALPVALVTRRTQRIGDLAAGTMVIRTKQKALLQHTILTNINPNYRVVFPQVERLSDRDVNIIRDVMRQSFETSNFRLMEYLGNKVKSVLGVYPPPQQLPTAQFLNIVLADYAHYNFEQK